MVFTSDVDSSLAGNLLSWPRISVVPAEQISGCRSAAVKVCVLWHRREDASQECVVTSFCGMQVVAVEVDERVSSCRESLRAAQLTDRTFRHHSREATCRFMELITLTIRANERQTQATVQLSEAVAPRAHEESYGRKKLARNSIHTIGESYGS